MQTHSTLLIVRPQPQHLHDVLFLQDLINEPVLNVDPARTGSRKIPDQLFKRWRVTERIDLEDSKQLLRFRLQSGRRKLLRVLLCLLRVDELPTHQSSALLQASTGSPIPSLIDSRIPGTDRR